MSEQIKYEAVFGDQALFDEAGNKFDEMHKFIGVMKCEHGSITVYSSYTNLLASYAEMFAKCDHRAPKIAMRRIIKTPVWTKADQQAEKLPEVGCKCRYLASELIKTVIAVTKTHIVLDDDNGKDPDALYHDEFMQYCRPLETHEERQQRVREEWCNSAAKLLKNLEYSSTLTSIYDALLSGELKMPEEM